MHAICPARCRVSEGLLPEHCVVVKEARGTKTTQVNACMATVDHDREGQAAHRQYKSRTVVGFASGKYMHNRARNSPHNTSVKFSESVCVASVASLTEEMAAQSIAYYAHGTADGDKFCCLISMACVP